MLLRIATFIIALTGLSSAADWSPQRAAQYLDSRQKEWFAWKEAASADGPCVSCHTGMTYLLARPALRQRLGESQPTSYETGLLDRLRAKAGAKPAGALQSVEAIFTALFLGYKEAPRAFDQLWSLQIQDGKNKGAWPWYSANLDPWENPGSPFYGAALAALAVGNAPAEYRERPEIRERVAALTQYLHSALETRPLHDRLALLWTEPKRQPVILNETLQKQQPDGGWTIASLGPWSPHADAPTATGSNSYATAFATYVLLKAGVARSDPSMVRALEWLKSHQDTQTGAWAADSMNKRYPPESMQVRFLQDAATAFATLALLSADQ